MELIVFAIYRISKKQQNLWYSLWMSQNTCLEANYERTASQLTRGSTESETNSVFPIGRIHEFGNYEVESLGNGSSYYYT